MRVEEFIDKIIVDGVEKTVTSFCAKPMHDHLLTMIPEAVTKILVSEFFKKHAVYSQYVTIKRTVKLNELLMKRIKEKKQQKYRIKKQ